MGSVTVTGGTWSITSSTLAEGTRNIRASRRRCQQRLRRLLDLSVTIDTTAPSGQTISADDGLINAAEASSTSFTFAGAEVGATYDLTVTSSGGGGSATATGTITSATEQITGIDVSGLPDGTLTYSSVLTDPAGNAAGAVTDTATLDTTAPSGQTISADDGLINAAEASSTSFTFAGAEVGATYDLTVTSSGGGGSVTATGTVSSATQQITGIDVSGLRRRHAHLFVVLTDPAGNAAGAVTDTATLDTGCAHRRRQHGRRGRRGRQRDGDEHRPRVHRRDRHRYQPSLHPERHHQRYRGAERRRPARTARRSRRPTSTPVTWRSVTTTPRRPRAASPSPSPTRPATC
ncbi:MAG: hypothetical protein U5O15_11055 [Candidatus Krumholzibacteriota bacterium]|nr:hypothetical protein [Candidatus Krumholzibacteriota bacterium]